MSHLKVFGSTCFVLLNNNEWTKLSPKSILCVFLGYGIEQKGYRCYDPKSNRLRISRNVTFHEQIPFYTLPAFAPATNTSPPIDPFPDLFPSEQSPPPPPLPIFKVYHHRPKGDSSVPVPGSTVPDASVPPDKRYPVRTREPASCFGFVCTDCLSSSYKTFLAAIHSFFEPQSYKETIATPEWRSAIEEELAALQNTDTWELVPFPPDKNVIGCKWVFKIKTKSNGSIDRYKAHLVAKGYHQEYGIDYKETLLL